MLAPLAVDDFFFREKTAENEKQRQNTIKPFSEMQHVKNCRHSNHTATKCFVKKNK